MAGAPTGALRAAFFLLLAALAFFQAGLYAARSAASASAAADAAADSYDYSGTPAPDPSRPSYPGRPDTIDETDEVAEEPYVIYTATPRPPAHHATPVVPASGAFAYPPPAHTPGAVIYSTSPASSPSSSPSPTLSPASDVSRSVKDLPLIGAGIGGPYFNARRASWRGPHSRHSSLSSISEEDEGLARL